MSKYADQLHVPVLQTGNVIILQDASSPRVWTIELPHTPILDELRRNPDAVVIRRFLRFLADSGYEVYDAESDRIDVTNTDHQTYIVLQYLGLSSREYEDELEAVESAFRAGEREAIRGA